MLITQKIEEAEILTVQLELSNKKARIINGYGPQESDCQQNRFNFWSGLEQEVISAKKLKLHADYSNRCKCQSWKEYNQ